jgi:hypothetical protein
MDVLEGKKDLDEFNVSFKDTTLTSKWGGAAVMRSATETKRAGEDKRSHWTPAWRVLTPYLAHGGEEGTECINLSPFVVCFLVHAPVFLGRVSLHFKYDLPIRPEHKLLRCKCSCIWLHHILF